MAKIIALAFNVLIVVGLTISLSVLNRQGFSLAWRAIGGSIMFFGYAHLIWLYRPRLLWAVLGAVMYLAYHVSCSSTCRHSVDHTDVRSIEFA
jgi:hypothetical protein